MVCESRKGFGSVRSRGTSCAKLHRGPGALICSGRAHERRRLGDAGHEPVTRPMRMTFVTTEQNN